MTEPEQQTLEKPDLSNLVLKHGSHGNRDQGMCVMEAVAYFAGLPHSDEPACTDRVLTRVCIRLNDRWDDEGRQKLLPLIPILVGTRGTLALSRRRAFLIVDRVIRSFLPAFLRELPGKPRPDLADQFEGLPPIVDRQSAGRARDKARELRDELQKSFAYAYAAAAADAAYAYAAAAADAADAYAYAAAAADAAYAYAAAAADAYAYAADAAAYAYAADAADAAAYAAAKDKILSLSANIALRAIREQTA